MGRVSLKLTEQDIEKIEKLAEIGLTVEQIASVWNRGRNAFFKIFKKHPEIKEAYDRGVAKSVEAISKTAYAMAASGSNTTMTIFWLKCRAGWRDVSSIEISDNSKAERLKAARERVNKPK